MMKIEQRQKETGKRKRAPFAGSRQKDTPPSFLLLPPACEETLRRATLTLADTDAPRLTAEALLSHMLGITRVQLLSRPKWELPAEALARFERLIARAARGEPLAYLTGHREFYGLDFLVDARVLVPRPETELLVDLALQVAATGVAATATLQCPLHILDVGAGSGCIAVTLAVKLPAAHITAVDISPEALALARLNAERHSVAGRITFVQSDLLSNLQPPLTNYHLLLANLPYIPSAELRRLPVADHEPGLALDGGLDGLALIRRLLEEAPQVMSPQGRLLLEIGAAQGEAAAALARAAFRGAQVSIHKDLAGLDRILAVAL